jgi:hypothetical protein
MNSGNYSSCNSNSNRAPEVYGMMSGKEEKGHNEKADSKLFFTAIIHTLL